MRIIKASLAAILLAGTLGSGGALADNAPQHLGATPQVTIGPAAGGVLFYQVTCMMGSGDVMADILLRNTSNATIPAGTNIHWQVANGGASGTFHVGRGGFGPGQVVEAGAAHYPFTCTASL